MINQRELWLVGFPFTNKNKTKVRPVLIISNNKYNHESLDVLCCGVTSNLKRSFCSITIKKDDLEQGELFQESNVRFDTLIRLKKFLFKKKIGCLKNEKFNEIKKKIIGLL